MTDEQILDKIKQIQTTFGMSNGRLAEILNMPLNTLKQKKYHKNYRFTQNDLDLIVGFLKNEAIKL